MIDNELLPDAFARLERATVNESYQAVLPDYPTTWETNHVYQVHIFETEDDDGNPLYGADLYDPYTGQVCNESPLSSQRLDAEDAALGMMHRLKQFAVEDN